MLKLSTLIDFYFEANSYQLQENTIDGKSRAFRYLIEAVGNKTIERFGVDGAETFKKFLIVEKALAKTSANMMLRDVGSIFSWAVNVKEWLDKNPFKQVKQFKVQQNRVNVYEDEQFATLMNAASPIWQIRLLLGRSGLRRGEALNLTKDNIRDGFIFIEPKRDTADTWLWTAKDYECRVVPLCDQLEELLSEAGYYVSLSKRLYSNCLRHHRQGRLSATRKKVPDQNFNRDFRLLELAAFGKRIGIFHDLRRTFITASLEENIPIQTIQAVSGIAKTRTLMTHYAVVRRSSVEGVREILNSSLKRRLPKGKPSQSAA